MKLILGILMLIVTAPADHHQCTLQRSIIQKDWIYLDMTLKCIAAVRVQIQVEIEAIFKYLSMAAFFSKDAVNKPGLAEFYFKTAHAKRKHAACLIDYLSTYGYLEHSLTHLIHLSGVEKNEWIDAAESLSDALYLQTTVIKRMITMLHKCERVHPRNYHLLRYLSSEYLEEQYEIQRHIAGKFFTIKKITSDQKALGEFIFDKKLLKDPHNV